MAERPYSAAASFALLLLCLAFAGGAGGCAALCPEPSPRAEGPCGAVRLRWPTCRRLSVIEQTCRRDRSNHLVVRLRFRNRSAGPFDAELRVRFFDEAGQPEPPPREPDQHTFPVGESPAIEWTSDRKDAVRYRITVDDAGMLPW